MLLLGEGGEGEGEGEYAVRADMRVVGVSMEDVEDRAKWRLLIHCGDP